MSILTTYAIPKYRSDPYCSNSTPKNNSRCPECGVFFQNGHWQWFDSHTICGRQSLCPACARIQDNNPSGYLTLIGEFFLKQQDAIVRLICTIEAHENVEHPLNRMMNLETDENGNTLVTFTDIYLPVIVGQALQSAYKGDLDIQHVKDRTEVRAYWRKH